MEELFLIDYSSAPFDTDAPVVPPEVPRPKPRPKVVVKKEEVPIARGARDARSAQDAQDARSISDLRERSTEPSKNKMTIELRKRSSKELAVYETRSRTRKETSQPSLKVPNFKSSSKENLRELFLGEHEQLVNRYTFFDDYIHAHGSARSVATAPDDSEEEEEGTGSDYESEEKPKETKGKKKATSQGSKQGKRK